MEVRSLATEAVLTERAGDLEASLELLRALRRKAPRDLTYILQFARIARRLELWDQAEDALKWGRLIFPEDVRPRRELITLYVERGDLGSANRIWNELLAEQGETDEVVRLRATILSARE